MKNIILNTICCTRFHWHRPLAWLVLLQLLPAPGLAGTVYQWTDAAGRTHFSDSAPPGMPVQRHELEPAPARLQATQGLRPGERASLQAIEQRLGHQHRSAQLARQQNSRVVAERRRDCQERRARQHRTGNHPARKKDITYLRRNCW